jgi:thiosulfate/3-mercaptopyruvate sulfurtransferase
VRPDFPNLVSTEWLGDRLGSPRLQVVDGSWYLPDSGRDALAEYLAGHIPGAVFFDLDASSDHRTSLPHMLPDEQIFARRMEALGLHDRDDLVVYDGSGNNLSAARVWWTFRVFGHERVAVLDGGMMKWGREQRPLEQGPLSPARGQFTARLDRRAVRDLAAVRTNLSSQQELVVDLRPSARFTGLAPEPRPGIRSGHLPGSVNLPFSRLVAPDGTILPESELRGLLRESGIDLSQPIIATCGSGTSACTLVLALDLLGFRDVAVYDGAWTEWGGQSDTPIETG